MGGEWIHGLSCWPMSRSCVIDWAAWGTWAGAIATFLAVVLPFYAARRKEALEMELAVRDFIREVNNIGLQLATIVGVLTTPTNMTEAQYASMLRIGAVIPVLQASTRARDILISLRSLRLAIEDWNSISALAIPLREGDGDSKLGRKFVDAMVSHHFDRVSNALDQTIVAIGRTYPDLATQIQQRETQ